MRLLAVLREVVNAFGEYLRTHPEASSFPQSLIAEQRAVVQTFWEDFGSSEINAWSDKPGVNALVFGTVVGRDLALYVHRFGAVFDRVIMQDPLSKVFLLATQQTPQGLFDELVPYLNVVLQLEEWMKREIVYFHPPFFLLDKPCRTRIIDLASQYCDNAGFRSAALTCPDRRLSATKMVAKYEKVFTHCFSPYFIDLQGGIRRFTEEYIVRTMAQVVATTQVLAATTGAIPVTSLERHLRLFCYSAKQPLRVTPIKIPLGLEDHDGFQLRQLHDTAQIRRLLQSLLIAGSEHATKGCEKLNKPASISGSEINTTDTLLYEAYILPLQQALLCLKVPFLSMEGIPLNKCFKNK